MIKQTHCKSWSELADASKYLTRFLVKWVMPRCFAVTEKMLINFTIISNIAVNTPKRINNMIVKLFSKSIFKNETMNWVFNVTEKQFWIDKKEKHHEQMLPILTLFARNFCLEAVEHNLIPFLMLMQLSFSQWKVHFKTLLTQISIEMLG